MIFMLDFSVNMKNCSVPDLLNSVVPSSVRNSRFRRSKKIIEENLLQFEVRDA